MSGKFKLKDKITPFKIHDGGEHDGRAYKHDVVYDSADIPLGYKSKFLEIKFTKEKSTKKSAAEEIK